MSVLDKLCRRIGFKPISVMVMLVTLLGLILLIEGYHGYRLDAELEKEATFQQQTVQTMQATLNKGLDEKRQLLAKLAKAVEAQNVSRLTQWQTQTAAILPDVQAVCVVLEKPLKPTDTGCLRLSFASLNSLRQLDEKTQSDAAMMQLGKDSQHILLAQRLEQLTAYPEAAILLALSPSWLDSLLDDSFVSQGYAEISQGSNQETVLTQLGNPKYKQAKAAFTVPIVDSYWQLNYWPQPVSISESWLLMALVAILFMLAWLLRDRWTAKLLMNDAEILQSALEDLQQEKLKPDYRLTLSPLAKVLTSIRGVALPKKTEPPMKTVPPEPATPITEQAQPVEPEVIVEEALVHAAQNVETEFEVATAVDTDSLPDEAIFRAYDVRGLVDKQLTPAVMKLLGQAVGSEALEQAQTRLVVGRDGRISSEAFSKAFIEGVLSTGCDVIDIGMVPTPVTYFACEFLETHTGAMITGSHNPAEYNGVKLVIAGKTLEGKAVHRLYQRIKDKRLKSGAGQRSQQNVIQAYIERIQSDVSIGRNMKVVIDCGNGVAGQVAPALFQALGCEVTELHCDVDGHFPNHAPNPGQPENLKDLIQSVKAREAELGLAFDGDGDRLGVVDAEGNIVWPDRLLLLLAQHVLVDEPGATVIYDVKSTNLLEDVISRAGGQPVMSPSGHSVIKNKMSELDAKLAGEMSGHIFFRDRWYGFDDALYSAARLLEFLAADPLERTPTEVFAAIPKRVNTPEIFVPMAEGESHPFIEQLQNNVEFIGGDISTIDGIRVNYPQGWGLVRASNTVPGLTLRFEATSQEELEIIKQAFIQQMLQIKPTLSLLF